MADILIPNIKIPEKGYATTIWLFDDGTAQFQERTEKVIELPEHGDLIEKQTALAALYSDYAYAAMDIIEKEVPVVISSNKEETE